MKLLPPQKLHPADYDPVRRELQVLFYDILFKPIIEILKANIKQPIILNERLEGIIEAIRAGAVQYDAGVFSGKFNAAISKQLRGMGAKFDKHAKVFRLDIMKVPDGIRSEAALTQQRAKDLHAEMKRALDNTRQNLDEAIKPFGENTGEMIKRIDNQWQAASKALAIQPQLTPEVKAKMATSYNTNLKTYAKKFSEERFEALRSMVDENAMSGYRYDNLVEKIRSEYGVAQRKAEFLARQETGLFMATFRKERFREAGVSQYIWYARGAGLTRPDHWALHGKVFSYDDPPIVDRATGRRGNPGEDFNCLCIDRPILSKGA
jgi:SPP1 gp7 family putative phage head morphogenesis protein